MATKLTFVSLKRASNKAKKKSRDAIRSQGRKEQVVLWRRFEAERFTDETQTIRSLAPFGPEWRTRKERLGLDMRKGHAYGGISRAIRSRSSFTKTREGFRFNFRAFTGSITVEPVKGRKFRRFVKNYIGAYIFWKAPGLGTLSKQQIRNLEKAARDSVRKVLITELGGTKKSNNRIGVKFPLDLV